VASWVRIGGLELFGYLLVELAQLAEDPGILQNLLMLQPPAQSGDNPRHVDWIGGVVLAASGAATNRAGHQAGSGEGGLTVDR
jgi:hypothetical protein